MVLHTLNATGLSPAYSDCLRLLQPDDALLLLGDGVYAGLAGSAAARQLANTGVTLYVLADDARAAGVTDRLSPEITVTDYSGFVALSEHYPRQIAWC